MLRNKDPKPEKDNDAAKEARQNGGAAEADIPTVTESGSGPSARVARHLPHIEGYRITGLLGQGGMGLVYAATQIKLNRTVALKVLPAVVGTANPSAVKRFRREATAAARLHHTNIVPIYDFGESRDSYYYAMELIVGKPLNVLVKSLADKSAENASPLQLAQFLQREVLGSDTDRIGSGSTSDSSDSHPSSSDVTGASSFGTGRRAYFRHVARWMADAADALHYAHEQGIIHRDIKPSNLILAEDGQIMIADFGLAKTVDESSYTMTGAFLGSLRYVSPEQAMAKRVRVDRRTDVYSLGATLYELLCFQPAFPGEDEKNILGAIIARDPTRPRKILPTVPVELDTICLRCLEKSPAARYATAQALADDLERYIHDLPIAAKRPGPIQRARKFVRRHRAAVFLSLAVLLLLAVSTPLVLHSKRETKLAKSKAEVASHERDAADLVSKAHALEAVGRWAEATELYERALTFDPRSVNVLGNLARMKKEQYNADPGVGSDVLEEAVELCNRALAISTPTSTNESQAVSGLLNLKGVLLKKLQRYDEAITTYEEAFALNPSYGPILENLGILIILNKGDLQDAKDRIHRAAELAGTHEYQCESPWRNLAALELHLGSAEVSKHLRQAMACKNDDAVTLLLRARMQLEMQEYLAPTNALDDAKVADFLTHRVDPRAKRIIAIAYLQSRQYDLATKIIHEALELGDMKAVDELILALVATKRGDSRAARIHLDAALIARPEAFREKNGYVATAERGILWFESARQWRKRYQQVMAFLSDHPAVP